jgi:hypothetical protein
VAFTKLAVTFPASFSDEPSRLGRKGLWTEMIDTRDWLTEPVFVQGLYQIVWRHKGNFLPEPATALEFFEAARAELERTAARAAEERAALAPPKPETPDVDAADPYSSTPEERERWAREDAGIRGWAARLGLYENPPRFPISPDAFERLPAAERDALMEQHRRNVAVANWPNLTPAERRAKERRIMARRLEFLASLSEEEKRGVVRRNVVAVRWKDGEVSRVELMSDRPWPKDDP